jgi:hypothetical protein
MTALSKRPMTVRWRQLSRETVWTDSAPSGVGCLLGWSGRSAEAVSTRIGTGHSSKHNAHAVAVEPAMVPEAKSAFRICGRDEQRDPLSATTIKTEGSK